MLPSPRLGFGDCGLVTDRVHRTLPSTRAMGQNGFVTPHDAHNEPRRWLALAPAYSQFLGICSLPGCRFKSTRRSLQKDIDELRNHGVQDIFVLCTRGELSKYRVPHLLEAYQSHRITVHHHPIPDGETPDITRCCLILNELRSCLKYNRKTLMQ
ncbi:Cyclin-dependent kinase inhibitor 3 [Varanus komodoensis]|nr:Cyclin-dependent kinase inhibitor 3 [Varanus komodoensis]